MRRRAFVAALVFLPLAVGDGGGQGGDKPLVYETPYYPLKTGLKQTYSVGSRRVTVRVARPEIVEFTKVDKGKEVKVKVQGYVLEVTSDKRIQTETVAVFEDGVYRVVSFGGKPFVPPLCFLKIPPAGQSLKWQVKSTRDNETVRGTFTVQEIRAKGFTQRVLEVKTTDFDAGGKQLTETRWFAEGVGLVLQHVESGDHKVEMNLVK